MTAPYRKHLLAVLLYAFILSSSLTVYARITQPADLPDKPVVENLSAIGTVSPAVESTIISPEQAEKPTAAPTKPQLPESPPETRNEAPPESRDKPLADRRQAETRRAELPLQNQSPSTQAPMSAPPAPTPEEERINVAPPPQVTPEPPPQLSEPAPSPAVQDSELNDYVGEVIATFTFSSPYLLNNDYANYNGVTEDLFYGGKLLARAHPSGLRYSHCSGITFEVFFKAMQNRNRSLGLSPDDFNGMTFDELFDFLLTWYAANGPKRTSNIEVAVEKYGIGTRVSRLEDAKRGDFMDISRRNGTGHTVVFQNWVRNSAGNITGVRYWSTQGSTNGAGYNTETFDHSGGSVLSNQVYIARILPVHQYKSFR